MRRVELLFQEYAQSHQNGWNKLIHNLAVPLIYFVTFGLVYSIPTPEIMQKYAITFAHIAVIPVLYYYFLLSGPIGAGMTIMTMLVFWFISVLEAQHIVVWQFSLVLFVVMWVLQFIGHQIEGKRPSFFKDLQFLLVGPAWILGGWLRKLNISY